MSEPLKPGERWITVHPNGADKEGHPIVVGPDGKIRGGLGGKYNGQPLSALYTGHTNFKWFEGRPLPDNLNYARPESNAHRKAFEHWGPEFEIHVLGDPEYVNGRWQAQVHNPHLANAIRAGYSRTPGGRPIIANDEGHVTYGSHTGYPAGRAGYTAFGLHMGQDLTAHIANYLAGEHLKRIPSARELSRPPTMVRQRQPGDPFLTDEERKPTSEAPWGYHATGRKVMGPGDPRDPLADPDWSPRPDILAQGRTPPAPPDLHPVPTSSQTQPASGPSWMNPLQALQRVFGRRAQPRDPTVQLVPPPALPAGPSSAPPAQTPGPAALPAPSPESAPEGSAASIFNAGPGRSMPGIRSEPVAPKEQPAAENPIEDLLQLAREREKAAWLSSDLEDTIQREGRAPTPEELQELGVMRQDLAEREGRMQDLIRRHGMDAQAVRSVLGEDFTPTPPAPPPAPTQAPPAASPAPAPAPAESALDRIAAEMAQENMPGEGEAEPPTSAAPAQSLAPVPEPGGALEPAVGGATDLAAGKVAAPPEEKSAGDVALPAPEPEPQASDDERQAELAAQLGRSGTSYEDWVRGEEERAGKKTWSAEEEQQAAELGLTPEELREYRDESEREAAGYEQEYGELAQSNKIIRDALTLGGANSSSFGPEEYKRIPFVLRRADASHSLDTLANEMNESYGYNFTDANELLDALERAGVTQVNNGIKAFGNEKPALSTFARMRKHERDLQNRRDRRALKKQGVSPPVRRKRPTDDVRLAADPDEQAALAAVQGGRPMNRPRAGSRKNKRMTPDCYAVPVKEMLPIGTGPEARQSWDALDRTPGLSAEERAEAERRILDALHVHGLPEHEGLAAALFAASHAKQDLDAESPPSGGMPGGLDDGMGGGLPMDDEEGAMGEGIPPDVSAEAEEEGESPEFEMAEQMGGGAPDEGLDEGMEGSSLEDEMPEEEEGLAAGGPPSGGLQGQGPPPAGLEDEEEGGGFGPGLASKPGAPGKGKPQAKAPMDDEDEDEDDDDEEEEEDEDEERAPVKGKVKEAVLDARRRERIKPGKFAFPEQRKLPIHDAAHVRAAMARFNQTQGMNPAQKKAAWARITRAARQLGVAVSAGQKRNTKDVHESEAPVSIPSRIPVQFMSVGHGNKKDGHFYSEDAVRALVDCVRGQPKMFISHSDAGEVSRHGHRPLEQLGAVAVRESVRYDPVRRACVGEAVLRPAMREYVETAHAAGDTIGISVDGKGLFRPGTRECVGWSQFYSADFVPRGGAGGFTLAVRESERPDLVDQEKEFVLMSLLSSLTAAEVREHNAELYEAIGRAYADAHPTEAVRETAAGDYERLVREHETMATERDEAMARLDQLEAERNREQVARFVDQLVRECGLEQPAQVSYVTKLFAGATCGPRGTYQTREELEGAVRETTEEYLATLPTAPSGEIMGQGAMRADGVRESAAWTNPLQIANEGMAMLWGHEPSKPASNGASAAS